MTLIVAKCISNVIFLWIFRNVNVTHIYIEVYQPERFLEFKNFRRHELVRLNELLGNPLLNWTQWLYWKTYLTKVTNIFGSILMQKTNICSTAWIWPDSTTVLSIIPYDSYGTSNEYSMWIRISSSLRNIDLGHSKGKNYLIAIFLFKSGKNASKHASLKVWGR